MQLLPSGPLRYDRVDSVYLDCVNDNLAVLLAHRGVTDIRTPFACQWEFDLREPSEIVLTHTPTEQLIRDLTGFAVRRHTYRTQELARLCAARIARDEPLLLFGDAFSLPWIPYFGREHMEHSFLIDGISEDGTHVHVVDAYDNRTEWGAASPTEAVVPLGQIIDSLEQLDSPNARVFVTLEREAEPSALDAAALLRASTSSIRRHVQQERSLRAFTEYYAQRTSQPAEVRAFVVACWLVARSREFHALWLADVSATEPRMVSPALAADFAEAVALPWQRLNEFAYIMSRRVAQGRAAPDHCFAMLANTIEPNEIRLALALEACVTQAGAAIASSALAGSDLPRPERPHSLAPA